MSKNVLFIEDVTTGYAICQFDNVPVPNVGDAIYLMGGLMSPAGHYKVVSKTWHPYPGLDELQCVVRVIIDE